MMKLYDITEKPLKIYGLAVADSEKRHFFRLPEEALERFPQYGYLGRRAVGGRVRFQTDAKKLYVKMTLAGTKEESIFRCPARRAQIFISERAQRRHISVTSRQRSISRARLQWRRLLTSRERRYS